MVIRLRKNGPIVVDDAEVQVLDWNGVAYAIDRRPVALCRCGASSRKPFCDGSHSKTGFQAPSASDLGPGQPTKP